MDRYRQIQRIDRDRYGKKQIDTDIDTDRCRQTQIQIDLDGWIGIFANIDANIHEDLDIDRYR